MHNWTGSYCYSGLTIWKQYLVLTESSADYAVEWGLSQFLFYELIMRHKYTMSLIILHSDKFFWVPHYSKVNHPSIQLANINISDKLLFFCYTVRKFRNETFIDFEFRGKKMWLRMWNKTNRAYIQGSCFCEHWSLRLATMQTTP